MMSTRTGPTTTIGMTIEIGDSVRLERTKAKGRPFAGPFFLVGRSDSREAAERTATRLYRRKVNHPSLIARADQVSTGISRPLGFVPLPLSM